VAGAAIGLRLPWIALLEKCRTEGGVTTIDRERVDRQSAEARAEVRVWAAGAVVVFVTIGVLLAAAALVVAFAIRPPLLGWLGFGVVSVVVFGLGILTVLAFPRLRAEAHGVRAAGSEGERRLLVIADSHCGEVLLCDEIQLRLGDAVAVHLVVPVRVSHLHYVTDDEAEERRDAEESMLISIRLLQQRGIPATGSVGGDDPLEAIADALAWFPATEVLLAVPPAEDTYWLERGLLARERALTTVAVTQAVVPSALSGAANDQRTEAEVTR
jgi:hypothetical protein